MPIDGLTDDDIRAILARTQRVALVGASNKPERASYGVMGFWLARGIEVVPVNPALAGQTIHGQTVVASLDEAGPLDLVDVFRASESVGPVAADAVRLGAKTLWMQLGVINEGAANEARRAGLTVVMDRCPKIEAPRLGLDEKWQSVSKSSILGS
jgi:predicted CoA-binding protein